MIKKIHIWCAVGLSLAGLASMTVAEDQDVVSAVTSYQFLDSLATTLDLPTVISPVVSYQYFDWPGDSNLSFQTSSQVSYRFEGPPVISQQPRNLIAMVGTNASFIIEADGSAPLGYQWRFKGSYMSWENTATLSITNVCIEDAGDYSVVVWNSYGAVTSTPVRLYVYLPPVTPRPAEPSITNSTVLPSATLTTRPRVPGNTQMHTFTGGGTIDRSKMTIILTHGWNSNSDGWPSSLANALIAKGYSANIIAWDWRDNAAEPEPASAAARTPSEGETLGGELINLLGSSYNKPIHFIGHSLGTMVNCRAADYIHGDTKNSRNSPVKFNPQNTHMTLFDEAGLVAPVNGMHVFGDVLLASLGFDRADHIDSAGSLLAGFGTWTKVIPERAAWIDNYVSDVGCTHAEAVNVLLWRNAALGVVQSHGYAYDWYLQTIFTPQDCLVGNRWSFERDTILSAPGVGTCYLQELDANPMTLHLREIGTVERSTLAFPTLAAYRGLTTLGGTMNSLGEVILGGYMTTIQYTGNLVADFAEFFTPLSGGPVFMGTANSTPAYFVPEGSVPTYQAGWDLEFSMQRPASQQVPKQLRNVMFMASEAVAPSNSVYTWIDVTVPREAVGIAFQFKLDGSAPSEFICMGISNATLFTMESKYVEDGVWQTTSALQIQQYAGQEVQLFFGLNDDTMPVGTLSVRGVQFFVPPRPELEISVSNNQSRIAWPVSALGWQLESVQSLFETNWTALTNAPTVQDYQRTVIDEEPFGQRFYRLRK